MRARGAGALGDGQGEGGFLGHAELGADEPGGVGGDVEGAGRGVEGDGEEDVVGVGVAGEGTVFQDFRRGVGDGAGLGAGDVQRGGGAGVSGVRPVGVPAGLDTQVQPEADGVVGGGGVCLGDQGGDGVGGGCGWGFQRLGGGGEEKQG